MEFSYKITEAEYRRFWRLRDRSFSMILFRFMRNQIFFWMAMMVTLVLLWVAVSAGSHTEEPDAHSKTETVVRPSSTPSKAEVKKPQQVLVVVVFIAILGTSVFALFISPRLQIKSRYRKDPLMQGTFNVVALPDSISLQNTSGFSSRTDWTLYRSWQEKGLDHLAHESRRCFPCQPYWSV